MPIVNLIRSPDVLRTLLRHISQKTTHSTLPYPLCGRLVLDLASNMSDYESNRSETDEWLLIDSECAESDISDTDISKIEKVISAMVVARQEGLFYALTAWMSNPNPDILKEYYNVINELKDTQGEKPMLFHNAWEHKSAEAAHAAASNVIWSGKPYDMYILDDSVNVDGFEIGHEWVDEKSGRRFVMDKLEKSDRDLMKKYTTVDYRDSYYDLLLEHPVLSGLTRCVREITGDQKHAVSWSVVHPNLSVGLTTTVPESMRMGLAGIAVKSLLVVYREAVSRVWNQGLPGDGLVPMRPYCFIFHDNVASQKLYEGTLGFRKVEGVEYHWFGVKY
ncbi:hypothetical protein HDU79_003364 [Rhizoclosmatium sp. JEL0117]|nr:hypothetical protein HDU79_003364 [Rhizoclosmatium sp. JEL0117]